MPRKEAEIRLDVLGHNVTEIKDAVTGLTASGLGAKAGYAWATALVIFVLALFREFVK